MISYNEFDKTVEELLKLPKYGILTGRIVDLKGLFQKALLTVLDFASKILGKLFKNIPEYNIKTIVEVFFVVAVTVLITVIILTVLYFMKRSKRKKVLKNGIFAEITDPSANFSDYVAKSDMFVSRGDMREAFRYRYIALLLHLRNASVINVYTARTDKQLKSDIKANAPDIYDSFSHLAEAFNSSWFGYKPINDDMQSRFFSLFDTLTIREAAK